MSSSVVPVPAGSYSIDPQQSIVRVRAKHFFGTGTVHATFSVAHGTVTVAEPLRNSAASATIAVASFTSDKTRRVERVLSGSLLDVAAHPEITFVSRLLRLEGDWVVAGDLTANGITRPVELRVTHAEPLDGGIRLRATTRVDRYEFGVTKVKGIAGRWMDLGVEVVGVRVV